MLDRAALAVPSGDEDPARVARMIGLRLLAVARLLGVLLAVGAGALGDDLWAGYWPSALAIAAGQLALTLLAFSDRWERFSEHVLPLLGLVAMGGLVAASGGAQSPAAMVVVAFPAIGAFVLERPRLLLSGAVLLVCVAAASVPDVLQEEPLAGRALVTNGLALVLATVVGAAIATGRTRLRDRVAALHQVRRGLLVDLLSAAATERRRISADLGAGPLQLLLAARQDLQELQETPDPRTLDRCTRTLRDAAERLRTTIVELRSPRTAAAPAEPQEADDAIADERTATRMLAVLRVAAAPPIAIAAMLGVPGSTPTSAVLVVLGVMGTVQAASLAWCFSDRWASFPARGLAYVDMASVGLLVALSGGAQSPVLAPAALLPLTFILLGPPPRQLSVVAVLAGSITAAALPDALQGEPRSVVSLVVVLLTLAWTSTVAFLATVGRRRLGLRTATLEAARRRLLRESVAAQDEERAAVARALHDDALQLVLAAIQELHAARTGAAEELAFALSHTDQAVVSLRDGADALHPSALERGGLGPALRDVTDRAARRGGYASTVDVAPSVSGRHDVLVVGLVRELVANVAKHARAATVTVAVRTAGDDGVALEVRDDGLGMVASRPREALAEGHVGLASCREQVEAAGGTLELQSSPGTGTTVRVRLP